MPRFEGTRPLAAMSARISASVRGAVPVAADALTPAGSAPDAGASTASVRGAVPVAADALTPAGSAPDAGAADALGAGAPDALRPCGSPDAVGAGAPGASAGESEATRAREQTIIRPST